MTIFQQSLVKRSTGSAASTTNPSRGSQRVSIPWSSTRSESSVHGFEEGCVALRRFPQLAEQEFDSIDRAHRIENTPQHVHFLQDVGGHQQFLLAGAGARDVDCGVSPFVGDLAVENDFRIAGALEFLEDHFVHARDGIDKRSRDDRQRAALLDIARGAKESLRALQGIGVDAAGEVLSEVRRALEWIDLSVANWQALPNLNVTRDKVNSVLLPDGRVLILGGIETLPDGGPAEIFDLEDPTSGFQLGPNMKHVRGYHSAAILLADGSVIMGGDPNGGTTPHERCLPSCF